MSCQWSRHPWSRRRADHLPRLSQRSRSMSLSATPASLLILAVTVGLSLLGLFAAPRIIEQNLFRPYWLKRKGQLHTIISSGFIHADLAHLLFNMFTFFFFAFPLE